MALVERGGASGREGRRGSEVAPVLDRLGDFALFLDEAFDEESAFTALRRSEGSGRPIGNEDWLRTLEARTGRTIVRQKPGRKPAAKRI